MNKGKIIKITYSVRNRLRKFALMAKDDWPGAKGLLKEIKQIILPEEDIEAYHTGKYPVKYHRIIRRFMNFYNDVVALDSLTKKEYALIVDWVDCFREVHSLHWGMLRTEQQKENIQINQNI